MRQAGASGPLIVVGVDGSDAAAQVLDWARQQALATGGRVRAVFAWHVDTLGRDLPARIESDLSEAAEKRLAGLVAPLSDIPVEQVVQEAAPAYLLLREAHEASLLVLGSHGHAGAGAAPLGSVVHACLSRASCPVVVVPVHG
jgi:nucleotide-binding universal stress UspA family protein